MICILFQPPHNEIQYSIVGDALAMEYFVIDKTTGEIYQRKSIQLEPTLAKEYKVILILVLKKIYLLYGQSVKIRYS